MNGLPQFTLGTFTRKCRLSKELWVIIRDYSHNNYWHHANVRSSWWNAHSAVINDPEVRLFVKYPSMSSRKCSLCGGDNALHNPHHGAIM